jgi:hypothetical protein
LKKIGATDIPTGFVGCAYFWFETRNNKLIELANMLYTLNRIQGTDYYYADLNKMYYHNNEQPNQ